jgi:transcriptional regulator with XRE-family HTH domain
MKVATSIDRLNDLFDSDSRSDTAIAKDLHVSKQTLSAWRKGRRSPKKTMLVKVAEYYNVSIEWIMGFNVEKCMDSTRSVIIPDSELFKKILMNMDPEDYKTVMEIFERTNLRMKEEGKL